METRDNRRRPRKTPLGRGPAREEQCPLPNLPITETLSSRFRATEATLSWLYTVMSHDPEPPGPGLDTGWTADAVLILASENRMETAAPPSRPNFAQ